MDSGLRLIILLLVGPPFYMLIRSWYLWWRIERKGVPVTAKVVSLRQGKGGFVKVLWITYSFTIPEGKDSDSQTYTAKRQVNRPAFRRAESTSEILVKYLPANPDVSLIAGDNFERNAITITAIGFLLIAALYITSASK